MKVTYVGDPLDLDAGPAVITHHGETFTKGEAKDVDDDHEFAEGFRTNPTFKVEGQKPPVRVQPAEGETAIDKIKASLTARGIKFDGRLGLAALQQVEAEANEKADAAAAKAVQG